MYQNAFWPGVTDLKTEFELWVTWFKEQIDCIIFKIYQFEAMLQV